MQTGFSFRPLCLPGNNIYRSIFYYLTVIVLIYYFVIFIWHITYDGADLEALVCGLLLSDLLFTLTPNQSVTFGF